jgi:hypothetical protein
LLTANSALEAPVTKLSSDVIGIGVVGLPYLAEHRSDRLRRGTRRRVVQVLVGKLVQFA